MKLARWFAFAVLALGVTGPVMRGAGALYSIEVQNARAGMMKTWGHLPLTPEVVREQLKKLE